MRYAMAALALVSSLSGCAFPTTGAMPPASPTPISNRLKGLVVAPWCLGGSSIVNANVEIRDNNNAIIGSTTTIYSDEPARLAFERARNTGQWQEQVAILDKMAGGGGSQAIVDWDTARRIPNNERQERIVLARIFGTPDMMCRVTFEADLPESPFYQLKIGTHAAPTYSFMDLQRQAWRIELSLD